MKTFLFYAAAALSFVSALHHIHRGTNELGPSWTHLQAKSRRAALTAWNYMTVPYTLTVLLNIKWARAGGPTDWEECGMAAALLVGGAVEALRCIRNQELLPLVAFVGIPVTSVVACII